MKLFFDTETTGLVDWKQPDDHFSQPRLVQLGLIYTEDDGTVRMTLGVILKPNGFEIPTEASNVHGITTEIAKAYGINGGTTFWGIVSDMFHNASEVISHNFRFDKTVMNGELVRHGHGMIDESKAFCTMEATTNVCKLPHKTNRRWKGQGQYKWPKCSEAYEYLFGEPLKGAHDALTDVRACMRIYFELKRCENEKREPLKYMVA